MKGIKKHIRDKRYTKWILLLSNWLFQGILNADKTEKIYKIVFTLFSWLIMFLILKKVTSLRLILLFLTSFVIAHSLNWIFNGNFHSLFIHRLSLRKLSKQNLFRYLDELKKRLDLQDWVLYAIAFGSICNGKLKADSDIDILIIRKPGLWNAIKSILFSIKEKKCADYDCIPLELYIVDSHLASLKRCAEQNPVVLSDPGGVAVKQYYKTLTIEKANLLNNF